MPIALTTAQLEENEREGREEGENSFHHPNYHHYHLPMMAATTTTTIHYKNHCYH